MSGPDVCAASRAGQNLDPDRQSGEGVSAIGSAPDVAIRLKDIADPAVRSRVALPRLTAHNACNPSVISRQGKLLAVYKGINYTLRKTGYQGWYGGFSVPFSDSQNYLAVLSEDLEIERAGFIEDRHIRANSYAYNGIQDLRLFSWNGKPFCAGAAITHKPEPELGGFRKIYRILLCELKGGTLHPVLLLPGWQDYEKNWMPWIRNNELHLIYAQDPYNILKIEQRTITDQIFPQARPELAGQSGGSCVVPFGDRFISVIHRKYPGVLNDPAEGEALVAYTHSLVIYSANCDVLAVSPEFTFEGERVEFCCGIALVGESVVFSYGVWDEEAVLLKLPLRDVLERLGLGAFSG